MLHSSHQEWIRSSLRCTSLWLWLVMRSQESKQHMERYWFESKKSTRWWPRCWTKSFLVIAEEVVWGYWLLAEYVIVLSSLLNSCCMPKESRKFHHLVENVTFYLIFWASELMAQSKSQYNNLSEGFNVTEASVSKLMSVLNEAHSPPWLVRNWSKPF